MRTRIVSFLPGTRSPDHTDAVLCHEASVEFGKSEVHQLIQLSFVRGMGVSQLHAFWNAILNIAAAALHDCILAREIADKRKDATMLTQCMKFRRKFGPLVHDPLFHCIVVLAPEASKCHECVFGVGSA